LASLVATATHPVEIEVAVVGGRRTDRSAAIGGVVFVALDVVVAIVIGTPLAGDAPVGEVSSYYVDGAASLEAGLWLFGLATIGLMWWFGALWRRMASVDDGTRLAVTSLVGFILAGALSFTASAVSAALALRADAIGDDAVILHALAVGPLYAATGFGLGAHLLATTLLGARGMAWPTWLVVIGVTSGILFVVSAVVGAMTVTGIAAGVGLPAFVLWCVWILGVSHRMWNGC
jgi:hypothetical protein